MRERLEKRKPDKPLEELPRIEKIEEIAGDTHHLKEGVRPIIACIGTLEQFALDYERSLMKWLEERLLGIHHNVDYYRPYKGKEFKQDGARSYVISPVDDLDKFSESFYNCTGMIAAGKDKETRENISFLSHQDPIHILVNKENEKRFKNDLNQTLVEIKKRSVEGTIDAVIFGGEYKKGRAKLQNDYLKSVKLLTTEVKKILGFEPLVITGPKTAEGRDDVYYDNAHRRLYIVRPEVGDATTESYAPRDIEKQKDKWE